MQSGHIIFLDHATTGDGVVAALMVLSVMLREGKSLSELARVMDPVPQVIVNKAVDSKEPIDELPRVTKAIQKVERALGKRGRVLVRYSGTENKVRIMIEGPSEERIKDYANRIARQFDT